MKSLVKAALVAAAIGSPLAAAQIAKGKVSHDDALVGHAHALVELSKMVPAAFKNKTSGDSAAKPEVWSDMAGFEAKAKDFENAAMAVADAAKNGPGAVKGTLGELFDTCKACHKEYRVKKD